MDHVFLMVKYNSKIAIKILAIIAWYYYKFHKCTCAVIEHWVTAWKISQVKCLWMIEQVNAYSTEIPSQSLVYQLSELVMCWAKSANVSCGTISCDIFHNLF